MANYLHKYGSLVLPSTLYPAEDPRAWNIPSAKKPRSHGGIVLPGYLEAKEFIIRGAIVRGPLQPAIVLRDELDSLNAALASQPQNYQVYDDRYWRCVRVKEHPAPYDPTHFDRLQLGINIRLITADPFQYSTSLSSDTWNAPASGATRAIVATGNAAGAPKFTITVPGSGTVTIAYDFFNDTTGESFALDGDIAGGSVIVVDTLLGTVMVGTTDYMSLFTGLFPSLAVGSNTLRVTYSGTAITSIVTEWRARWW